MSLQRAGLVLFGAMVIALSGVAFRASRDKAGSEARRLALVAEQKKLRTALDQARPRESTAPAGLPSAWAQGPLTTLNDKTLAPERSGTVSIGALRANNLELANLWIASRGAALNQTYGPFFQAQGLPTEQVERLKAIMMKRIAARNDIGAVALTEEMEYRDATIQELLRQVDQTARGAEAALLDPDIFRQLENYRRSLPARGLADGLAGFVAFLDPLSAPQAEQLTQIVAAASPAFNAGGDVVLEEIAWTAVDEKALAVLRPPQFAIWQSGGSRDVRGGNSRAQIQLQNAYDRAVKTDQEVAPSRETTSQADSP